MFDGGIEILSAFADGVAKTGGETCRADAIYSPTDVSFIQIFGPAAVFILGMCLLAVLTPRRMEGPNI